MKLSVCTISFRHHLVSMDAIAHWARSQRFQGIELWGVHARNLEPDPKYDAEWLSAFGLRVSMLSDYLPLDGSEAELRERTARLRTLSARWRTEKIRTFAGGRGSAATSERERWRLVQRLRVACEVLFDAGVYLLVETHPNTLADCTESTLRLIDEVGHPALRVNFDVLHLWESGEEPSRSLRALRPHVAHFHLKNVKSRDLLGEFAPDNVYAPAGSRAGMVPLFEGAFDYNGFFSKVPELSKLEASLEWFGGNVVTTLRRDAARLRQLEPGALCSPVSTARGV